MVRCLRCGHENRAAISLSICDKCGSDISILPDLSQPSNERDLRVKPDEFVVTEAPAAPTGPASPPPSAPSAPATSVPLAWAALTFFGRILIAVAALAAGVSAGLSLQTGTALASDEYAAGSIAILAAAAAISGLIMILVSGGRERSHRVTFGVRALGFLLTALGVWAVTTIAHVMVREEHGSIPIEPRGPQITWPGPGVARPDTLMGPGTGYLKGPMLPQSHWGPGSGSTSAPEARAAGRRSNAKADQAGPVRPFRESSRPRSGTQPR